MSFFAKTLEFINESGQTSGVYYLENAAELYYDFTRLTGSDGSNISNGNAGLVDYSGNGNTAVIVGTPQVRDYTVNAESIKTLRDTLTQGVSINTTGGTIFNKSFDLYMVIQSEDGQIASTYSIFGAQAATTFYGISVYVNTAGEVGIAYANSSGVFNRKTSNALFINGANKPMILRFSLDFENDLVTIYKNGTEMVSAYVAGTIVGIDPSLSAADFSLNMYVGTLNSAGTATTNSQVNSIFSLSVFPLSASIAIYVREALMDFSWKNWATKEIHVTAANVAAQRAAAIADIYNGGSLPTVTPTVTTGISGAIHICNTANVSNASSWDELEFVTTDVDAESWTHYCYLAHTNQTPNGKLLIVNNGHASDVASGYESLMSQALGYGYDVLYTAMPKVGDNTTTNATVPGSSSTGHNQFLSGGLDRVGYNPMGLFLFDKFSAIDYLDASYSEIISNGNSGGGWTSVWLGALDERVTQTFMNRGVAPRSFKVNEAGIDYEQGGMPSYTWDNSILGSTTSGTRLYATYTNTTYFDLMAMCASSGRKVFNFTHVEDSCCFIGTTSWVWMDTLKSLCGEMGGEFHKRIDFLSTRASHQFTEKDITDMFHALGDL